MPGGVRTFEELRIFQEARCLAGMIWKITSNKPFASDWVLIGQLRRASLSIVSNIAEGFERGSRAEFGRFLKIAKGSCGEVRAQMLIASDLSYISKRECDDFCNTARQVSSGLSKLALYLRPNHRSKKEQKHRGEGAHEGANLFTLHLALYTLHAYRASWPAASVARARFRVRSAWRRRWKRCSPASRRTDRRPAT